MAKPFAVVELIGLVEEERLDLDLPLGAYVPGSSVHSHFPDVDAITQQYILADTYDVYGCPSFGLIGPDRLGERSIKWEDRRLFLSGGAGPHFPT